MKLIDRQIKAVEKTLKQVKRRYRGHKNYHLFDDNKCAFCLEFDGSNNCEEKKECPMFLLHSHKCIYFIEENEYDYLTIPLEDIAGFLQSLLVSLEELR